MITPIYIELLNEAKQSPSLLSDLAGLETYISESYNNRSFIELLQNADDAQSDAFVVKMVNDLLVIANNGRKFDSTDIRSLCRSASSSKTRGKSIGYRGIGFKSVVSIADEVHLISGEYEITFSKDLTKELIPNAANVPLIRIPHPIRKEVFNRVEKDIKILKEKGYNTFFIFTGINSNHIKEEYQSFQVTSLLFLNNIRKIDIEFEEIKSIELSVNNLGNNIKRIIINSSSKVSEWEIYSEDGCNIAFCIENNSIKRLSKEEAFIHAFLPTEDTCGLGVIINADFSTDPSRRHLIYDEITNNTILSVVKLYNNILINKLSNYCINAHEYINALLPYYDIRLTYLTKNNFENLFSSNLKNIAGNEFKELKLVPQWINLNDYIKINKNKNSFYLNESVFEIIGFASLVKFLGGTNDDINNILNNIDGVEISLLGYSQISAECIRKININIEIPAFRNAHIIPSNNVICSLEEIEKHNGTIDTNFIQLLNDKGISNNDIKVCLRKLSCDKIISQQFNNDETIIKEIPLNKSISNNSINNKIESKPHWFEKLPSNTTQQISTPKKWRSAEENTLIVLNAEGFKLKDVSKQNIGYDLEGLDPDGNNVYVEVKSLDFRGQKFRMTNNEYAVAQYYREKYYLALVIQTQNKIEIDLIKDPINHLAMNRQCVQWVWECSEYSGKTITFDL